MSIKVNIKVWKEQLCYGPEVGKHGSRIGRIILQLGLISGLATVQAQFGQDQAPANDRHLRQTGECLA